jgi:hypothetical protein
VLAVQYGMGADALAMRIGQPPIRARELLSLHRETYRVFWRWSDAAVDYAMLRSGLHMLCATARPSPPAVRDGWRNASTALSLSLKCGTGYPGAFLVSFVWSTKV